MRRTATLAVSLVFPLALLAGCGGSSSDSNCQASTKPIDITFSGDSVSPKAERVDACVDQPIKLHVQSDEPGEIHVHSSPEQQLEYQAGTTDLTLKIDQPGVVEVESHTLDVTILQLEVK